MLLFTMCFVAPLAAQTSCVAVDATNLCSGEEITAIATTQLSEEAPQINTINGAASSTLNKAGNSVMETNSNAAQSAVATSAGGTTIVNRNDGSSATITRAADTTFVNESSGQVVVCQLFGTVTLCN